MKKYILLAITVLLAKFSIAQWSTVTGSTTNIYNTNTGFVGIGTGNTVPTSFVDIRKDQSTATIVKVRNQSSISGAAAGYEMATLNANSYLRSILYYNVGSSYYHWSLGSHANAALFDGNEFVWRNPAGTNTYMKITSGGTVGIGTANPGSFKLAVEGTIGTRAIKVLSTTPFPDYVFKPDYPLPSIRDVETYINQHQHLPGVPSAAEVEKDGGFELGEMDRKLLEKVEELTLYIIQLNKKIEQMDELLRKAGLQP